MTFLIIMTTVSLIRNFRTFADNPLLVLSAIILALEVWLILEAILVIGHSWSRREPVLAETSLD